MKQQRRNRIIEFIKANPELKQGELAKKFGIATRTVKRYRATLRGDSSALKTETCSPSQGGDIPLIRRVEIPVYNYAYEKPRRRVD